MKLKLLLMPTLTNKSFSYDFDATSMFPLSLGVLTSKLRSEGFEVNVDDLNIKYQRLGSGGNSPLNVDVFSDFERCVSYVEKGQDQEIESMLEKIFSYTDMDGFDYYLVSLFDHQWVLTMNLGFHLASLFYIKKNFGGKVIAGTASHRYYELVPYLKGKDILDHLIIGYGEESLITLLKDPNVNGSSVPGVVFSNSDGDGGEGIDKVSKLENINRKLNLELLPDFRGLPEELYKRKVSGKKILIIPYKLSHGCVVRCAYCPESGMKNRLLGFAEPRDAVKNLKILKERHGTPFFSFFDMTFNISEKFVREFCNEILDQKLKIYWTDSARLDARSLTDKNLELMREAGCIGLVYGLESGSQRMLDFVEKKVSLKDASNVLRKASDVGIWNTVNLLAGMPSETDEDVQSTIDFMRDHESVIDEYVLCYFKLLETSSFGVSPEKYGITNTKVNTEEVHTKKGLHYVNEFYSFDEKNGLSWEEKSRKMQENYKRIRENVNVPTQLLNYNQPTLLYYLYSRYKSKDKIRAEYNKMRRYVNLRTKLNYYNNYTHSNNLPDLRKIFNRIFHGVKA